MKTLSEIRDEMAEEYFPTFGSGAFVQGFDSGANAVMEQAQKLVEALFYAHSTYHSAHAAFLGSCGICSALKEWQEFVGSQK